MQLWCLFSVAFSCSTCHSASSICHCPHKQRELLFDWKIKILRFWLVHFIYFSTLSKTTAYIMVKLFCVIQVLTQQSLQHSSVNYFLWSTTSPQQLRLSFHLFVSLQLVVLLKHSRSCAISLSSLRKYSTALCLTLSLSIRFHRNPSFPPSIIALFRSSFFWWIDLLKRQDTTLLFLEVADSSSDKTSHPSATNRFCYLIVIDWTIPFPTPRYLYLKSRQRLLVSRFLSDSDALFAVLSHSALFHFSIQQPVRRAKRISSSAPSTAPLRLPINMPQ